MQGQVIKFAARASRYLIQVLDSETMQWVEIPARYLQDEPDRSALENATANYEWIREHVRKLRPLRLYDTAEKRVLDEEK